MQRERETSLAMKWSDFQLCCTKRYGVLSGRANGTLIQEPDLGIDAFYDNPFRDGSES